MAIYIEMGLVHPAVARSTAFGVGDFCPVTLEAGQHAAVGDQEATEVGSDDDVVTAIVLG